MAPKPLYLASSLAELQKMAAVGNVANYKCKALHSSSEKLIKEAVHQSDMGDEEKAYILYMKFLNVYQKIITHKEYKADKKYWDSMMGDKKAYKNAVEELEKLDKNLDRRYADKEMDQVQKKLSKAATSKGDVNGNNDISGDRNEKLEAAKVVELLSLIKEKCTFDQAFGTTDCSEEAKKSDLTLDVEKVREAAIARDWIQVEVKQKEKDYSLLRFQKEEGKWQINIYCSTGAVQTTLTHPTKGRNQLDRSVRNLKELISILDNPRKHTNRGYRRNVNKPKE